ncbi:protein terminal ear1 homolog [Corylus avellana]|uniref:protein terminal ear1 homolog n=1 Tax=Corylus avellana TaxID=13451 RepID=UPI00286AFE19|nr:protein terminal ear1 homolog [Corylus avellana]
MAIMVPQRGLNPNAPEFIPMLFPQLTTSSPDLPYYLPPPTQTFLCYHAPFLRTFYTNICFPTTQPSLFLPPPQKDLVSVIEPTISFVAEPPPPEQTHPAQNAVEQKMVAKKTNPRRYRNQCYGGRGGAWWEKCSEGENFCRKNVESLRKYDPNARGVLSRAEAKKKNYSSVLPVESGVRKTTIMIRNIPSKYTRNMLVEFLDDHCMLENQKLNTKNSEEHVVSAFDFVYLPIDFRTGCNKGYAFVNFTDPRAVWKFYLAAHKQTWKLFHSHKIREISLARLQGGELLRHFESMGFPCESEQVLPVCFSPPRDGSRELVKEMVVGRCTGMTGKQQQQQLLSGSPSKSSCV